MKKWIALLMAGIMLLALTACGQTESTQESSQPAAETAEQTTAGETVEQETPAVVKDTLVFGVDTEPSTLDPIESSDKSAYALFNAVYEKLWYYDSEGEIVYQLATGYDYDETGTVMTISLREGVTFHNGNVFTAEDVLYTLGLVAANESHANDVAMINFEESQIVDDYTIELHLNQVSARLPYALSQPYMSIVDKEFCEANPDNYVTTVENGTGAYVLDAWNIGDAFVLSAYESYWGDAPVCTNVSIKFISDEFTRMMEFEAGNLDVAMVGTASYVDDLQAGMYADASLVQKASGSVFGIEINMVTPQWAELYDDINLRKAMFHSIDVDAILKNITGSTTVAATSILPSSCWAYKDVGTYEYDVEYAKECLAAAGYEPGELTISLLYPPDGFAAQIWEAVQGYWGEIGIDLQIEGAEFSVWGPGMVNGDFALALGNAQNCVDPSDAFNPRKVNGGMLPMVWPADELAELDAAAEATTDVAERMELYAQIQQIMYDGYYALPLYESTNNWAVQNSVVGWGESCDGLCVPNLALVG